MIHYETEHLLLCQFRDFKRLNSLENKATLEQLLSGLAAGEKLGHFQSSAGATLSKAPNHQRLRCLSRAAFSLWHLSLSDCTYMCSFYVHVDSRYLLCNKKSKNVNFP